MIKKTVLAAALLVLSVNVFAGKIAVLDAQRSLSQTQVAKDKIAALRAKPEFTKMMAEAEGLRADISVLEKEVQTKGVTWTAEERADHRKSLEYRGAEYKLAMQKLQAEQNAVGQAIMTELQPKLEKVLTDYMAKEDIDVVLRREAVFLAQPVVDITDAITAELDNVK